MEELHGRRENNNPCACPLIGESVCRVYGQ